MYASLAKLREWAEKTGDPDLLQFLEQYKRTAPEVRFCLQILPRQTWTGPDEEVGPEGEKVTPVKVKPHSVGYYSSKRGYTRNEYGLGKPR